MAGLQDTGVDVAESRTGYTTLTHKRIDIAAALAAADTFPDFVEQQDNTPTDPGPQTPDQSPQTDWIPGVPNAGDAQRTKSIIVLALSVIALIGVNSISWFGRTRNAA